MLVDLLVGLLTSGGMSRPGEPPFSNAFVLVCIDPGSEARDAYLAELPGFVEWVKSAAPLDGADEIVIPGEPETRRRAATDEIVLDEPTLLALTELGAAAGVGEPWGGQPARGLGSCLDGHRRRATAGRAATGGRASGGRRPAAPAPHRAVIGPPAWFLREEGRLAWRRAFGVGVPKRDWLEVPVQAFLVEHPGVGPILIDTGFHPSVAVKPTQNLGRLSQFTFKDVKMEPDQAVSAQLREKGIEPADVKVVVMTHLHSDHASAIAEFPEATFVVSKPEWDAATTQGEFHGYVRRQFDHGFDYRLLDFDDPGASSFSGFGRSFDLFGDGSVRTVFTPGHSRDISVVVRLPDREVLVAADAIYLLRTLEEEHLPYRMADEHLFRRSLREIRQYRKETPDALMIPGHDWEAWQELDSVYGARE